MNRGNRRNQRNNRPIFQVVRVQNNQEEIDAAEMEFLNRRRAREEIIELMQEEYQERERRRNQRREERRRIVRERERNEAMRAEENVRIGIPGANNWLAQPEPFLFRVCGEFARAVREEHQPFARAVLNAMSNINGRPVLFYVDGNVTFFKVLHYRYTRREVFETELVKQIKFNVRYFTEARPREPLSTNVFYIINNDIYQKMRAADYCFFCFYNLSDQKRGEIYQFFMDHWAERRFMISRGSFQNLYFLTETEKGWYLNTRETNIPGRRTKIAWRQYLAWKMGQVPEFLDGEEPGNCFEQKMFVHHCLLDNPFFRFEIARVGRIDRMYLSNENYPIRFPAPLEMERRIIMEMEEEVRLDNPLRFLDYFEENNFEFVDDEPEEPVEIVDLRDVEPIFENVGVGENRDFDWNEDDSTSLSE